MFMALLCDDNQAVKQGLMAEHRHVCPNEMVECSLCRTCICRGSLTAHQQDPSLVMTHLLAMEQKFEQKIQELRTHNRLLEKRLDLVMSRERDLLVQALRSVSRVHRLQRNSTLVVAAETIMGTEAFGRIRSKQMKTDYLLVGLLDFLATDHAVIGQQGAAIIASETVEAITKLIGGSEGQGGGGPVESLVGHGASRVMVRVLDAIPAHRGLQLHGWSLLASMIRGNNEAHRQAVESGVCELVGRALVAFHADREIQESCCQVVGYLSDGESDQILQAVERLGKAGACEAVISAMKAFPRYKDLQGHGCYAVTKLAYRHEHNRLLLRDCGACQAVLSALKAFPSDRRIQYLSIWSVLNLSVDSEGASILGKLGACESVVSGMRSFPTDRDVQLNGCWALLDLAFNNEANRALIAKAGGCECVVAALRAFRGDEGVLLPAVWAILNLACDSNIAELLGHLGACDAVVAALQTFPRDQAVQIRGFWAIENLVSGCDANVTKFSQAGACFVVVEGVVASPDARDLQVHGCGAIAGLANSDENKIALANAGACEAVIKAMHTFPDDVNIQKKGCLAVHQLATGHEANRIRLMHGGAMDVINRASFAFSADEDLCDKAQKASQVIITATTSSPDGVESAFLLG